MTVPLGRGFSLANKCLLLFGCAVSLILILALAVPWIQTSNLVSEYQLEVAQQVADALEDDSLERVSWSINLRDLDDSKRTANSREADVIAGYLPWDAIKRSLAGDDPDTIERKYAQKFQDAFAGPKPQPYFAETRDDDMGPGAIFLYAQPLSMSVPEHSLNDGASGSTRENTPAGLIIVQRSTSFGQTQLWNSQIRILIAGLVAFIICMIFIRWVLSKLILKPVDRLDSVIGKVTQGEVEARSNLTTGDELQSLSQGLDEMLDELMESQDRLQRMNENLDLKVAELAEANIGLWESTRFKTEFLANISHELRTPLNSIIGFTELLHDKAVEEEEPDSRRTRYLSNILNSGRSLLDMINELLDMAKIEAGRMEVNLEPTSIGDLIELLTRAMAPQAESKNITLATSIPKDLPLIETDPGKVQQIIYNLLSNAVKFSPSDSTVGIRIESRPTVRGDQHGKIVIAVSDQGPGIPVDMHDVIFEKFRQIDASHTRTHMGTGLGLAICRELVDMLQGEIWLESADGAGATFFLSLNPKFQKQAPQSLMGKSSD
tara:strand:+ start:77 stop:1723 length:1647 start_codon:yes stop_codon:yes gene_type:complete